MERIEIEVDNTTAEKWRSASTEFKEIIFKHHYRL